MKKIHLLFIFFFFTCRICFSQNLVLNPNFEDTIPCAVWFPNFTPPGPCQFWISGDSLGSADYFTNVFTGSFCTVFNYMPSNVFGFQYPHSLNSYVGFGAYNGPSYPNRREYITGMLVEPLQFGHKYCVEFFVSAANNCLYQTDDLGAYFSNNPLTYPLNYTPQIENTQGSILSDTLNWMLISGSFFAQGGEKYITIGNFKNDANTTISILPGATEAFGYYLLDDVSVTDCSLGINQLDNYNKILLYPNPFGNILNITAETNDLLEITIFDFTLREILKNKFITFTSLSTAQLAKGIYYFEVVSNKKLFKRGKIIKD